MLIALTFAHFLSELLLKEQMIIPVKKKRSQTLVISMQNWSILAKLAKKKTSEIGCFLLIVSWRSFPPKFPLKSADFPKNPSKIDFIPLKSREMGWFFCEFWLFSRENRPKLADCSANFDFFPAKSADFSTNLPLKIPRNFAFSSTKYQKPCFLYNMSDMLIPC